MCLDVAWRNFRLPGCSGRVGLDNGETEPHVGLVQIAISLFLGEMVKPDSPTSDVQRSENIG